MKSRTAVIGLIGLFGLFIIILRIESAAGPKLREKRASELQCPAAKEARTGDTETLRFLMKPGMDVFKHLTVECLYRDVDSETPRVFFVFRLGEEDLNSQDKTFKGKTVILYEGPSSGNFLLKMTVDRPGTYCCTVEEEVNKDSCSTTLTVGEQDPERGMDPATIIGGGIGGGIVIIGGIGGIIGGIIFYCKRKGRRMVNQGTGEEMQRLEGNRDPEAAPEA